VPDGKVPWSLVFRRFTENSKSLEPWLRQLVHAKLAERTPASGSGDCGKQLRGRLRPWGATFGRGMARPGGASNRNSGGWGWRDKYATYRSQRSPVRFWPRLPIANLRVFGLRCARMLAIWRLSAQKVPGPFLAALALATGYLAFVAWDQSHWWRVKQDYTFGWLVPLFVAFVVHDRWHEMVARLGAVCGGREARGPAAGRNGCCGSWWAGPWRSAS